MFGTIANEFEPELKDTVVITGGDINSRVGDLIHPPDKCGVYRDNPDKQVNSHGKFVADICSSFKCYALNNLTFKGKIFDGKYTFHKADRKSQNDIVIGNLYSLNMISSFTIHELGYNPSDHFPLVVTCKFSSRIDDFMNVAASDLLTEGHSVCVKRKKKISSVNVNWDSYKQIAKHEIDLMQNSVQNLVDDPSQSLLDTNINNLSSVLYNSAKSCSTASSAVSRTNDQCAIPFQEILDESNSVLSRYISGAASSQDWHAARLLAVEETKKLHFSSISAKWSEVLSKSNTKELWNKIDWKGDVDGSKAFHDNTPSSSDLAEHFLTKCDANEPFDISEIPKDQYVDALDRPLELSELHDSARLLKDKSTCDGWCPQMINTIPAFLYPVVLMLFNVMLSCALFPTKWCRTVVAALFKNKGSPSIAKYFRPITLVHMLYKWFDFTLLERFKSWFKPADEQTAYQFLKSCADHIFLLRALICYAKKKGKKLFICAIDFDGAFDRVSRSILLKKLARFGAGSAFLLCIAAMYQHTESVIIQNDNYCVYQLLSGIKQGLPLSPFLFIFYINDIFDYFYRLYNNVPNADMILDRLHIVIHADDANILASSRTFLVDKILDMINYCKENKIMLQLSKCMFLVINGSDADKVSISIGNDNIPSTSKLLLLGSWLTESGSLAQDLCLHIKYRFKSCIKFFNFLRTNRLAPITVKLKVLCSCVTNALLYNCETFGPELPKGIEGLYFKLIKSALNVRPSTPNMIALIESGLLPIRALIQKRQIKFYRRFKRSLGVNSVRSRLLDELLHPDNITKFLKYYVELDEKYANPNTIYTEAMSKLKSEFNIKAANKEKHYKFYIYKELNPELLPSPFLSCPSADAITRFRCGSHHLPIETMRWGRVSRENRLCSRCGVLGDEFHFIFDCVDFPGYFESCNHDLKQIWKHADVFNYFSMLSRTDFLKNY